MKVFVSSLIGGYEEHRAAAQEAIETLVTRSCGQRIFRPRPERPSKRALPLSVAPTWSYS
jgi:hypothetical protein